MDIKEYISQNWKKTIRIKGKQSGALDLPYNYSSPCAEGLFDDLYYWDTYFINLALLESGLDKIALNNILDFAFLIEKYGFIPNSANEGMLNRTQVPLFIWMCDDYLNKNPSETLKKELFPIMEKEYEWWMKNRLLDCGLNAYKSHASQDFYRFFALEYKNRVGVIDGNKSKEEIGFCALAECESGWDFSQRFLQNCPNYAPVDLNSILYRSEGILASFAHDLNLDRPYNSLQIKRKKLMDKYLLDDGLYYDYDSFNNKKRYYFNCAMFFPFISGVSVSSSSFSKLCDALIYPYGLACGEKNNDHHIYQWGFPNMWPNLVLVAFKAAINLKEYNYAKQIGLKYLNAVENEYLSSGKLWEKYDVMTGKRATNNEYSETEMMGWTAAGYVLIEKECRKYGFIK